MFIKKIIIAIVSFFKARFTFNKKTTVIAKKLDCDKIKAARRLIRDGKSTIEKMAKKYGCAESTLMRALDGKTYRKCLDR